MRDIPLSPVETAIANAVRDALFPPRREILCSVEEGGREAGYLSKDAPKSEVRTFVMLLNARGVSNRVYEEVYAKLRARGDITALIEDGIATGVYEGFR